MVASSPGSLAIDMAVALAIGMAAALAVSTAVMAVSTTIMDMGSSLEQP